jgi:DNA-binding NarL/FixJ family response regulator
MIRVLIADDQALVRGGFASILSTQDDIEVAAEAADGARAVELCRRLQPDVVLMDIRMPILDGIAATQAVTEHGNARVLILTTFDLDEYVYSALKAGASGFILKDSPAEELPAAVRTVAAGHALLAPSVTRKVIEEYVRTPAPGAPLPEAVQALTERERAVLKAMAAGLSNAEIGRQLYLAEATVKTHVTHVLAKLGLRDRLQAAVYAYESGLIRPGQPLVKGGLAESPGST